MNQRGCQTIECDVKSCQYNVEADCMCSLSEIKIAPKPGCCSKRDDESLCSSYKCRNC